MNRNDRPVNMNVAAPVKGAGMNSAVGGRPRTGRKVRFSHKEAV